LIDLHTHLLPGVDDGSPSVEVSLGVLQRFAADGVDVVVCTPHLRASQAVKIADSTYASVFDTLIAAAPPRPVLKRGWEIMLDVPGADLSARTLTLGGSTAMLVEFPRTGVPLRAIDELRRVRNEGRVPVLAHPERYWGCTLSQIRSWREGGTVMQIDAVALLAGGRMGEMAVALIEEGLADCLASDNHGDTRSLSMLREWFVEQDAEEHAALLTEVNPRRLLEDLPVLPVPPVRVRRGLLDRLRELMRGRRR
jgi:protein-tyrosine phosphatase